MKKNIVASVLMLALLAVSVDVIAQKGKKKGKGSKTPAKTEQNGNGSNSSTGAGSTEPAAPVEPAAIEPAEDTGVSTPEIIAEVDSFDFKDVALDTTKITDGYLKLQRLKGAKPFPFPPDDLNNVKLYKRLWREINTTDSENRIFSMPGETLIQFLLDGIKNGKLIAYSDESCKKKMTYAKAVAAIRPDSANITLIDTATGEITGYKRQKQDFNPDSVTKFEIKEDIYFDKTRGRLVTKIITICPLKKNVTSTGQDIGDSHPFYINFKQARQLLAAKEVSDPQRDIENISFDDIFLQRAFKSLIVKEYNPAGTRIKDKYPDRARQIKESNRIEREIQRYKRSLWKFN